MKRYNPTEIEKKWQDKWEADDTYVTVRIDVGEGDRLVAVRDDEKSDNRTVGGSVSDPDGTPVEPDSFE